MEQLLNAQKSQVETIINGHDFIIEGHKFQMDREKEWSEQEAKVFAFPIFTFFFSSSRKFTVFTRFRNLMTSISLWQRSIVAFSAVIRLRGEDALRMKLI
jgi:hypothetical protein